MELDLAWGIFRIIEFEDFFFPSMDDRIDGTYHYADLPEYVRSCFERAVFIL
jgi:hypothetical protein